VHPELHDRVRIRPWLYSSFLAQASRWSPDLTITFRGRFWSGRSLHDHHVGIVGGIVVLTVDTLVADLSSQAAVRKLASEAVARYPKIDILINNAGAMHTTRQLTEDGIELTWAVNHLAAFLLTTLLLDRLKASAPSRIITTASAAHRGAHISFDDLNADTSYRGFGRYKESKLANILFTSELAHRLEGSGVSPYCFHPGLVASGFNRNNGILMSLGMLLLHPVSRSVEKGAETLVWLTNAPKVELTNGGYYVDMEWRPPSPEGQSMETARRLWEISEAQCAAREGAEGPI
jgi:NAD(P)-dependent dehydrogenase (short-subunit alcohol dehydrogenase family)